MKTILRLLLSSGIPFLFTFCPVFSVAQVQIGRNFINVTKGQTGGTIERGDTLEVRTTIVVPSGTTINKCSYYELIPSPTKYVTGTLKLLTNEGLVYKALTDQMDQDNAEMIGTTNVWFGIGKGATSTVGGTIVGGTDKPTFYGNTTILVVAYRVRVDTTPGTIIQMHYGTFTYTPAKTYSNGNPQPVSVSVSETQLVVYNNLGLCANVIGANAILDNGGTFGSGTTQNGASSILVPTTSTDLVTSPPYVYELFAAGQPNDGYYGVANNTSSNGSTNTTVAWGNGARVFGVWDIIGDHTGAADPATGNGPTTPGSNGGYMGVVNASYQISAAIEQTVSGLCPNTYYEFSAWFRNICSKCACDSNGNNYAATNFVGIDAAGVRPNLAFEINGLQYYTTGDIPYSGKWQKKGFVYKTGTSETSFKLTIRNNSPGGGGNDWAIDDIALVTCFPDIAFSPALISSCLGAQVGIVATVNSYYDNYTNYLWEISTDGGATWTNTGLTGSETAIASGSSFTYDVHYPVFTATQSDSSKLFRLRIATTSGNLSSSACSVADGTNVVTLEVKNCSVLTSTLLGFSGRLKSGDALLNWSTTKEIGGDYFELERSADGVTFNALARVPASKGSEAELKYAYIDRSINGMEYYRIRYVDAGSKQQYSNVVVLSAGNRLGFQSVENPFKDVISAQVVSPVNQHAEAVLVDVSGRIVAASKVELKEGSNAVSIPVQSVLSTGVYYLRIVAVEGVISKALLKQ